MDHLEVTWGPKAHDMNKQSSVESKVIKTITGHKTDSMFERYSHIDGEDLKIAAEVIEKYQNGYAEEA